MSSSVRKITAAPAGSATRPDHGLRAHEHGEIFLKPAASRVRSVRNAVFLFVMATLSACASLSLSDPLNISVANIDPLPGEGLELRLAVTIRVQNPNDAPVEYTGAALDLDLNGRKLASGVSDTVGTVPRYGEAVFTIPVTITAFDVARQLLGFMTDRNSSEIDYRVRGKLEGGLFGTRRFSDQGTFRLPDLAARGSGAAPVGR